jgi:hypothetical protein
MPNRVPYFQRPNEAGTIVAMRERSMVPDRLPFLAIALIAIPGCDPIVNIAGANFPAWLLCAIGGATLAALFRPVFVMTRLEAYLWPVAIVYGCLGFVLACVLYLTFFGRT